MQIEHHPGRFVARVGELEAELVYRRDGDVLDVHHTYTPPELRGQEIAAHLTDAVFAYARAEGLRVRPTCSYTEAYVVRHPELRSLAVDG